ncbi:MAG TPA: hypothetical protein VGO92_09565 [Acidimicrobiales bacterium]|nr:hypothetical protein [Acidimicrobiales bacterium]
MRGVVMAVCAAGIGGMIAGSVAGNNAFAMTFGLLTAAAVLCLIVATAVSRPRTPEAGQDAGPEVEARIAALAGQGVDEQALRELVQAAVEVGRTGR